MNVLFVNYGDFTTNSLNHIAGFARGLAELGHSCAVAVPDRKETLSAVPEAGFLAVTYAEALSKPRLFPDGRAADILHAWTPREVVRTFVLAYQVGARARLVIHLEDNEEFLLSAWLGKPFEAVRDLGELDLAAKTPTALPHPRRYRHFLAAADGATVIVATLKEFVPPGLPCEVLEPGVDFGRYRPQPADPALRRELGIDEAEKVVVLTGSNTFANEPEMRDLYEAVSLLNARGLPCRLVRTGLNTEAFQASLPPRVGAFVKDLGFLPKARLPALLALADVLVQPGKPGPFNDFRLPSKLPEFLSSGRPVVLPASNIGLELRDGIDALLLREGTPEEIAAACTRIFADPDLARTLAENGAAFARRRFDLAANCRRLAETYAALLAAPLHPGSTAGMSGPETELSLALRSLAARTADPEAARLAADLAPLVQSLERQEPSLAERRRVEAERDEWKNRHDLTQQHAENLNRQVEVADELTRIANDRTRAANQRIRTANRQLAQLRGQLQRLNEALQARDRTAEGLREEIAQRDSRIEGMAERIADRERKIRAMQESTSWRVTQPLRFVRRTLLDPRRPAAAAPATAAPSTPAPAAAIALTACVDKPPSWHLPPRRILVGGWCFAEDGRRLTGVRVVLADRTLTGLYGLPRKDVLAAVHGKPQAEACGWQAEVDFRPTDTRLAIEVGDETGAWHRFFETELRVAEGQGPFDAAAYQTWIEIYDGPAFDGAAPLDEWLLDTPLISVVMPVYNPPERWLRRAIESVREQLYSHWELCIADDASTAPHVRAVLEEAAAADPRIKVRYRSENGHISAASNSALDLVAGEFVGLLDHDDELAPDALFEVAAALDARPQTDLIYSDEDKIDEDGRRHHPYFKPDWMPDLITGQNFVSHLSVYRTSLVRAVGGFRVGYEGSQDWDLVLRAVERTTPDRIVHIPKVLYHWRAIPGSTAVRVSEKNYSVDAARRALAEHFERRGDRVELLPVPGDNWRVKYPLPPEPPLVSLVIPTRNQVAYLKRCVDSILEKTTYPSFEILIVDNGSDDPAALEYLRSLQDGSHPLLRPGRRVEVLRRDAPFNYSALNNDAASRARGQLLGLLNNDLEVISPDWLEEMAGQALRPDIGCVGAMLYYPNDTIQHAGVVLGLGGVAGHAFRHFPRATDGAFNRARLAQNYSAVTAACLVVRAELFQRVGGLDEQALAVAFNDVDLCLKVRAAGYRNLWTPFAEFYHHESVSRGPEDTVEKFARFRAEIATMQERWGRLLENDPAYNPNLTLDFPDYSLASPPRLWALELA